MTITPNDEIDADLTPEQAVRVAAWQHALWLQDRLAQAENSARGGTGGGGHRDPGARTAADTYRTQLAAVVAEHGFENTRVHGLGYFEQRAASYDVPAVDRPACTHNTDTCPVHWAARRHPDLKATACGGAA